MFEPLRWVMYREKRRWKGRLWRAHTRGDRDGLGLVRPCSRDCGCGFNSLREEA